jgi:hypothetical protein
MKRFVVLHCGSRDHKREIDDEGRIILDPIGAARDPKCVYRTTLRTSIHGNTDEERERDIRERISRLIDASAPFDSIEFIEE